MKPIHTISICLLSGLIGGCSQDARSNFLSDYDPIGDAIDNSLEKSRRKSSENYYKNKGANKKEASRMAFEDEVWAGGASEHTPLERHKWENPDYPAR
jgi:hypothetical protein